MTAHSLPEREMSKTSQNWLKSVNIFSFIGFLAVLGASIWYAVAQPSYKKIIAFQESIVHQHVRDHNAQNISDVVSSCGNYPNELEVKAFERTAGSDRLSDNLIHSAHENRIVKSTCGLLFADLHDAKGIWQQVPPNERTPDSEITDRQPIKTAKLRALYDAALSKRSMSQAVTMNILFTLGYTVFVCVMSALRMRIAGAHLRKNIIWLQSIYYLGFILTLTSLIVAMTTSGDLSSTEKIGQIFVQNAIALSSTVIGLIIYILGRILVAGVFNSRGVEANPSPPSSQVDPPSSQAGPPSSQAGPPSPPPDPKPPKEDPPMSDDHEIALIKDDIKKIHTSLEAVRSNINHLHDVAVQRADMVSIRNLKNEMDSKFSEQRNSIERALNLLTIVHNAVLEVGLAPGGCGPSSSEYTATKALMDDLRDTLSEIAEEQRNQNALNAQLLERHMLGLQQSLEQSWAAERAAFKAEIAELLRQQNEQFQREIINTIKGAQDQ